MWKEQILSGIGEDPDKPKIFIKKKVRNHSYHQFYPVLANIRINRIRINQGLLYISSLLQYSIRIVNWLLMSSRCVLNMKHFQTSEYSQEMTSMTEKKNQEEDPEV